MTARPILGLAIVVILLSSKHGNPEVFEGAFINDAFSRFLKVLTLVGALVSIVYTCQPTTTLSQLQTMMPVLGFFIMGGFGNFAAYLPELFPTRIRYTSMSLPYHIGNGWFGGLLPTTAFAIVAQTGNMYNGLWYPIIIAAITFVIGTLFIHETKDVDIYQHD